MKGWTKPFVLITLILTISGCQGAGCDMERGLWAGMDRETQNQIAWQESRVRQEAEAAAARRAQQDWETMRWQWYVFVTGLMVIALVGTAGLFYSGCRYLNRRASRIYPDENGLFPVIQIPVGPHTTVVHDPNRAPSSTTIYRQITGDDRTRTEAHYLTEEDLQPLIAAATQRAQAVQGLVAVSANDRQEAAEACKHERRMRRIDLWRALTASDRAIPMPPEAGGVIPWLWFTPDTTSLQSQAEVKEQ